jgi:ribosome-binding protein aMBF1 (putative translation factor)
MPKRLFDRYVIDWSGGPVATRTPDLYRVKVKQPLQDQQRWLQVVDSVFERMGQKGPDRQSTGHKGPESSGALFAIPLALGKCVRHARQHLGCTVEALATASGLPVEYIRAVETGRVEMSIRALTVICHALGLSGAIIFRRLAISREGTL